MFIKRFSLMTFLMFALPMWAKGQDVFVSLKEKDGTYAIWGHFFVETSTAVGWNVLTDYDHISNFVSSMEFSRVKTRDSDDLRVEQKASARFLFFSRAAYVLLVIQEKPYERINFEDVSHKDFDRYAGFWKIEPTQEGLLVCYGLDIKSRFFVPGFIKRKAIRTSVGDLLEQVKFEMLRRAKGK